MVQERGRRAGSSRARGTMVKGRRRAYKPGPEMAQPRERLRVLIEQGSQYMIPPDYVAMARPDFFTEAYREKVVKYINEVRQQQVPAIAKPMGLPSTPVGRSCSPLACRAIPECPGPPTQRPPFAPAQDDPDPRPFRDACPACRGFWATGADGRHRVQLLRPLHPHRAAQGPHQQATDADVCLHVHAHLGQVFRPQAAADLGARDLA